jgi:nifR3 family TIM-barrel protein
MVSAEGLARGSPKTLELLHRAANERLFAVQIFASRPETAALAVRKLSARRPDLYDLNCGCSAAKVLKSGCGAALLRDPEIIAAIVGAMRSETDRPVTVKLRNGWDHNSISYEACAEAAQRGGAAMISLHPRTRTQGFSGSIRLSELKTLKSRSSVPVIGSGDLFAPEDALRMFEDTGCDGLMFARGALGNPFIFTAAKELLQGRQTAAPPTVDKRLETALEQLRRTAELKGEARACKEMRKHFCHYTKGIPGGAELRARAVRARRTEDYRSLVERFLGTDSFP